MPGLKDIFQKAAQTAHAVFKDVAIKVDYHSIGTFTYDATAGTNVESGGHDQKAVRFIFENYSTKEIDNEIILSTDQKASVPVLNLEMVPKPSDYLTKPLTVDEEEGVVWNVVGVKTDPAEAAWELQVRKS